MFGDSTHWNETITLTRVQHTMATFTDFRFDKASSSTYDNIKSIEHCHQILEKWKPGKPINPVSQIQLKDCASKSPFKLDFIRTKSAGAVPEDMRTEILHSIKTGFKSGYRGAGFYPRDFSSTFKPEDEEIAFAAMDKEVKKGHCVGPFDECPFPNSWCDKQPVLCKMFFKDKQKFIQDGQKRLLGNKSYPVRRSFNDLIPRLDSKEFISNYEYFTFGNLLGEIQKAGKNCLLSSFDVKDAFKNCRMATSELWQQVYKVQKKFYIDLGGTFGSRNAGDAWNRVMEVLIRSARKHCKVQAIFCYVDNIIIITPPLNGKPDLDRANREFESVLKFMIQAGVPVHELLTPNSSMKLLRWLFNTKQMEISCPPERRKWADEIIKGGSKTCSLKTLQSSAGVLEFLAQGLPFLRAPLGWLHRKIANYRALSTQDLDSLKHRFIHYMGYVRSLLDDWNGSASIYIATDTTKPDMVIYSDASGTKGFGYLDIKSRQYGLGKWSQLDLKNAHRESETSSTFLEILAMAIAIRSLAKDNTALEIFCDSKPALFALERRYYRGALEGQNIIIGLDKYCRDHGIATFYKHKPREDPNIKLVDALSRGIIPEGLINNGHKSNNHRIKSPFSEVYV